MENHEEVLARVASKVERISGTVEGLAGIAQVMIIAFPDLGRFDEGLRSIEESLPSLRASGINGQKIDQEFLIGFEETIQRMRAVLDQFRAVQDTGSYHGENSLEIQSRTYVRAR